MASRKKVAAKRERVSLREYARRRGVQHSGLVKAIQLGRMSRAADGLIDPDVADRELAENTDFSTARNPITGNPKMRRGAGDPQMPMDLGLVRDRAAEDDDPPGASTPSGAAKYATARAIRESFAAKRERSAFLREEGLLVEIEDVRKAAFDSSRRARDHLLAIADRLASVVAALSDIDVCREAIVKEIEAACDEISKEPVIERRRGRGHH